MVNRDYYFDDIAWDEDCYLPRRRSGQSTCNIAAPLGEENYRLRPTLVNLAQTNIDLDQTLDELDAMGKAYLQVALENAMLKQQQGGPDVEAPSILTESPQGTYEAMETPTPAPTLTHRRISHKYVINTHRCARVCLVSFLFNG